MLIVPVQILMFRVVKGSVLLAGAAGERSEAHAASTAKQEKAPEASAGEGLLHVHMQSYQSNSSKPAPSKAPIVPHAIAASGPVMCDMS